MKGDALSRRLIVHVCQHPREGRRIFSKVSHTYHTGKDDIKRTGAFYAFHGDKVWSMA